MDPHTVKKWRQHPLVEWGLIVAIQAPWDLQWAFKHRLHKNKQDKIQQ